VRRPAVLLSALVLALAPSPDTLVAQVRGDAARPSQLGVNARVGYDLDLDGPLLGAGLVVGVPRVPFAVQAVGDVTFLDRVNERQLALDVLYRWGRSLGVGGGPVFRNTIFETDGGLLGPRETRTGYSLVASLGAVAPRSGRLLTGFELRWVWIENFRPQTLTAQVGLSLLRW
jgi:hypothetical protein